MSFPSRFPSAVVLALAIVFGAGCAAPATSPALQADAGTTTDDAVPSPRAAPPMSDPLPPEPLPESVPAKPQTDAAAALDRSCRTSADCAVKNVGNCCGYMPACVNADAKPDPDAVQAQCAKQGMVSVCGFQEIQACQCVQGQCEADSAAGTVR